MEHLPEIAGLTAEQAAQVVLMDSHASMEFVHKKPQVNCNLQKVIGIGLRGWTIREKDHIINCMCMD